MGQISDDLRLGPVFLPNQSNPGPAVMELGVGPMGRLYVYDIVPAAPAAATLAAAQAVAGAGNLALTAGANVTAFTDPTGAVRYLLDVPRAVSLVSSNVGDTTQTATVSGYDTYGQPMTATVTLNGTTTVSTKKAFASVTKIALSAATVGNISAGVANTYGLPFVVNDAGYIDPSWAGALARDAGTLVKADATSPATSLTGDVRGTYTPSSAANGTNRLIVDIDLTSAQCGPQATRLAAAGVTQA